MDEENLEQNIQLYEQQLQQVDAILSAAPSPEIETLRAQIQGALVESQTALLAIKKARLLQTLSPPAIVAGSSRDTPVSVFDDHDIESISSSSSSSDSDEETNFQDVPKKGDRCLALFPPMNTFYHAVVLSVDIPPTATNRQRRRQPKPILKVKFARPVSNSMKLCQFYESGKCTYGEGCRFSHGQILDADKVISLEPRNRDHEQHQQQQAFQASIAEDPLFMADSTLLTPKSHCMAKYSHDGLWYECVIDSVVDPPPSQSPADGGSVEDEVRKKFWVTFTGYGNKDLVDRMDICPKDTFGFESKDIVQSDDESEDSDICEMKRREEAESSDSDEEDDYFKSPPPAVHLTLSSTKSLPFVSVGRVNTEEEARKSAMMDGAGTEGHLPPKASDSEGLGSWEKHTRGIGSLLMSKMGYVPGQGLGRAGQGRMNPITAEVFPPGRSLDSIGEIRERRILKQKEAEAADKMSGRVVSGIVDYTGQAVPRKPGQPRGRRRHHHRHPTTQNVFDFLNKKLNHPVGDDHPTDQKIEIFYEPKKSAKNRTTTKEKDIFAEYLKPETGASKETEKSLFPTSGSNISPSVELSKSCKPQAKTLAGASISDVNEGIFVVREQIVNLEKQERWLRDSIERNAKRDPTTSESLKVKLKDTEKKLAELRGKKRTLEGGLKAKTDAKKLVKF